MVVLATALMMSEDWHYTFLLYKKTTKKDKTKQIPRLEGSNPHSPPPPFPLKYLWVCLFADIPINLQARVQAAKKYSWKEKVVSNLHHHTH